MIGAVEELWIRRFVREAGGDRLPLLAGRVAPRESPRTLSACGCV